MIWPIFLTLYMLAVMAYDATSFRIPNLLVGVLLVLYPVHVFTSPTPIFWLPALGLAFGCFVIGYVCFLLRWMGGGDVKLFAVCMLWLGLTPAALSFFIWMGILGGVLAIGVLGLRMLLPMLLAPLKITVHIPRLLTVGEPLPYGLAIAGGFLVILWTGQVPGIPIQF